jgi:hypothetical protein
MVWLVALGWSALWAGGVYRLLRRGKDPGIASFAAGIVFAVVMLFTSLNILFADNSPCHEDGCWASYY